MNYIYIGFSIITIIQVIKRRFDFISFGAITFIAYSINCAFGQTWITGGKTGYYYQSEISLMTYMLVISQLLIINIYIFIERHGIVFVWGGGKHRDINNAPKTDSSFTDYPLFWNIVLAFCYFSFAYNIFVKIGISNFFSYSSKNILVENVSSIFSFAIWGTILCFLHAVKNNNKKNIGFSFFLILITVLIGSRAYLATVIIGWIAIKSGTIRSTLRENLKIFIIGGIGVLALLLYKNIYMAVRALDFSNIKSVLSSGIAITSISDIAEFRTVFSLYDYVVTSGFRLPFVDSIARIISIIPMANNYLELEYPIRLSDYLKNEMHSSYGLGSNFWAESVAMGGLLLLCIMTILWLIYLKKSSRFIKEKSDASIFVISSAAYISFYIHRLDWIQVMGCFKSIIIIYFLYFIWKSFSRRKV